MAVETPETEAPGDPNYQIDPERVRDAVAAVGDRDPLRARELIEDLHPSDVAEFLEAMPGDVPGLFANLLGESLEPEVLAELSSEVRSDVVQAVDPAVTAKALDELESDDAAFILEDVQGDLLEQILRQTESDTQEAVRSNLAYGEDQAGRIMQRAFYAAPAHRTVGEIIDHMRGSDDLPDRFYEVFVVDAAFHPVGSVPLALILKSSREITVGSVMRDDLHVVNDTQDQEDVAYLFEKYNLVSTPVVDDAGRLVGMITVDDVVEVVQEEAQEDMLRLAGVSDQGISQKIPRIVRSRFTWLLVNLGTAILASVVIALFGYAIEELVALAVLMPIVASMGGNAGTQTMTVAVRALATRELNALNGLRIVARETAVGAINGTLFAVILGVLSALWFANVPLGVIVGIAMIANLVIAGLVGILIPVGLQRMGADPAVSSAVFVTTVTDVVGFFVFLGLAALVLL